MRFREIFRFELAYQVRRPWPWLFLIVLLVFDFLTARETSLADALYEDFFANSPFAIAQTTVVGSLIWLVVGAAIAGEAAARDVATGMYPLIYTTPVSKAEYLGARFLAAFVLNALILLAVPVSIVLAVYSPGVHPEVIGPFGPAAYLTAYAFIALPNAFVATSIQFALAVRSGRPMASYPGSMLLVFTGFFLATFVRFFFVHRLGMLLDPIGINFIVDDLSHQWTKVEKKWRLLALEGTVLRNRLLWVGIGLSVLLVTYLHFRFAHRSAGSWWRRRTQRRQAAAPSPLPGGVAAGIPISVPQVPHAFGFAFQVRQTGAIAWTSFRTIATSWTGLAMLVAIPLLSVLVVIDQMESMETPLPPMTIRVLRELTAPLSAELSRWVIVPLLIIFFAGELIWREREARMGEITDSMPGSEWTPLLGKFLGLGFVLAVFMALLMTVGIIAQVIMGYQDFEIMLYLKVMFGLQLPEYLLFAVPALAVHVLANQKYIGHLAAILVYAFIAVLATMLGIEHNLLVYGAGPGWSYTAMRGFGGSLGPWLQFKLYWAAWAMLLAVAARLLWVRGSEGGLGVRIRLARRRFTRTTAVAGTVAAGLIFLSGGFIFYNTNILNHYRSSSRVKEWQAGYEQRYRRYEHLPQPRLTATNLRIEIYAAQRAADIRGSYRLRNASAVPIKSIHVSTGTGGANTRAVSFDRSARLVTRDDQYGYCIYALEKPLQPGDTLKLDFEVVVGRRGFTNRGVDPSIAANGSYFTSGAWFPSVGYQSSRELLSAADRRSYGLAPRPVVASLDDPESSGAVAGGEGTAFHAIVGTEADQIAVAPGALHRTWTEKARRYFHYITSAPVGGDWAFFSAKYAVYEGKWNDVAIRIFHYPEHTGHLKRTMQSVRASLNYYTSQFGPYPYRHLSIIEHPGAPGTGLHAESGMIWHGQGFPFWKPEAGQSSFDQPYAVMAHEMGHQFQARYAPVEGAPLLSESFAWYGAMQVVKASRGAAEFRRLLAFMRRPYPFQPIRRGEPLLRALDPYLAYRRGPFALHTLSEYIGTGRVNLALRRLIEQHEPAAASLATTLDLYRELQAVTPDSLRYLLHDLFEVNTYWEFKTERSTAVQTNTGAWQVTLDVRARKQVFDSAGVETVVPMNDWVEVGVFAPAGEGGALSTPLYMQKHRIHSGQQTIAVTVPRKPARAGIDPNHLLIGLETGEHTIEVKTEK